jgi:hypothetical protein
MVSDDQIDADKDVVMSRIEVEAPLTQKAGDIKCYIASNLSGRPAKTQQQEAQSRLDGH